MESATPLVFLRCERRPWILERIVFQFLSQFTVVADVYPRHFFVHVDDQHVSYDLAYFASFVSRSSGDRLH